MSLVDKIVHAATIISSTIPSIEPQSLLSHHRKLLQAALVSLEQALQSQKSDRINAHSQNEHSENPDSPDITHAQAPQPRAGDFQEVLRSPDAGQVEVAESLASACSQSPRSDVVSLEPTQAQNEQTSESDVEILMAKLEKNQKVIQSFTNKKHDDAISREKSWTGLDPRHVDIKLGKRGCSSTEKFRAWLARYSFADEYLTWAQETFGGSRHQYLILNAKDAGNRGKGGISHVSDFMSSLSFNDESTRKAIQYGLKYHSFEHMYQCQGVSAFLFYVFTSFRQLPYASMQDLKEAIRQSKTWSTLAEQKADWIVQCLLIYNEDCGKYRHKHGQKRPIDPEGGERGSNKRAGMVSTRKLAANDMTVGDTGSAAQNATCDNIYDPAPPLGLSDLETEPTHNDRTRESPREEGYDPFDVDFDFLIQELDDQMSRAIKDPLACGEQAAHRPGGYDPFEEDFTFILNEVDD